MPGPDATHWLHRFDAEEWLAAALNELASARTQLDRRSQRSGLASARRAAGMGWNAALAVIHSSAGVAEEPDSKWGRTYIDHLRALATLGTVGEFTDPPKVGREHGEFRWPEAVTQAAKTLLEDSAAGPRDGARLVQILTKRHDSVLYEAAQTIVAEGYTYVVRARAKATPPATNDP